MRIDGVLPIRPPVAPVAPEAALPAGPGFSEMFANALDNTARAQNQASASIESLLNGETQDIHKVALAAQRASLQFDLFMQVRNKLVSAYQEVMRSQL